MFSKLLLSNIVFYRISQKGEIIANKLEEIKDTQLITLTIHSMLHNTLCFTAVQ